MFYFIYCHLNINFLINFSSITMYRIYSIIRPSSNKRSPRISAHPARKPKTLICAQHHPLPTKHICVLAQLNEPLYCFCLVHVRFCSMFCLVKKNLTCYPLFCYRLKIFSLPENQIEEISSRLVRNLSSYIKKA